MTEISIEFLKTKMINQMRINRKIFTLNDLESSIYSHDFSNTQTILIIDLDSFLSELGIFLTKNKKLVFIKQITRDEINFSVSLFINFFKKELPISLINKEKEIFKKLNKNGIIEINDLLKIVDYKKLPLVHFFGKTIEYAKNKLEDVIKFNSIDGIEINEKNFINLNRDIYSLLSSENEENFISEFQQIWGFE